MTAEQGRMRPPMRILPFAGFCLTAVLCVGPDAAGPGASPAMAAAQTPAAPPGTDAYTLGADSQRQPGVPAGKVEGPLIWKSRVFPNTWREYWIYVPAQYDASVPAAVMIFQDGHK